MFDFTFDPIPLISSGESFKFYLPALSDTGEISFRFGSLQFTLYGSGSALLPDFVLDHNASFSRAGAYTSMTFGDTGFSIYGYFDSDWDNALCSPEAAAVNAWYCHPFYNPIWPDKNTGFNIAYYNGMGINARILGSPSPAYNINLFNGEEIVCTAVGDMYKIGTATIDNLFSDAGVLVGTDYVADKSICPDGLWHDWKDFGDWVAGQSLGVSVPGRIDVDAYPGVDTWPGEVTGDMDFDDVKPFPDVSTWPGTIDITVPRDLDDVISIPTDVARDYPIDNTGDDDQTQDEDKPKPGTPPGGLPLVSIPEILFKEKFPFCLPWDIYNLFVGFNSEPTPPKFDIPFKFEDLGIDYTFTIDLSQFEDIAKISRFSLSVLFVVALIMLSRKLTGSG